MIKSDIVKLPKNSTPKKMVLFLHGVGSNAEDLISLADYFPENNDILFASPNGPENFDMANFGYQWFSLQNRSKESLLEGLSKASQSLEPYIKKKLLDHNISRDKLIVVGFSQGAMLSMYHFLHSPEKIAGVVAISGALIDNNEAFISKPNVLIMHGEFDDVVPFEEFTYAVNRLKTEGVNLEELVMKRTAHHLNQEGVRKMVDFCQKNLSF